MLIGASCSKADEAPRDEATRRETPAIAREWIELRVEAPGMDPAQIETLVVRPIEAVVRSAPRLQHVIAEAGDGRARLWLAFEPGERDAVLIDLRARVIELEPKLPPEIDPPQLRMVDAPGFTFVRWAIESDVIDPSALSKLHAQVVGRVEQLPGVLDIQTCVPRSRVVIELEPERLQAYAIEPGEIETALRGALLDAALDLESLRRTVVASDAERGTIVTLADVAAIRYGMRESTCVAASALGLVAAASVNLRDRSSSLALEQLLDDVAAGLPARTRLRRFDTGDTTIELSVAPDRELDEVAESIGSGLVRLAQPWLVEVGVEAPACVGAGTRVRVSLAGAEPVSLASFESIPGVTHVQLLDAPGERWLWLVGPDLEELHELGRREQTRLRALEGLLAVNLHIEAPRSELRIEPDPERLAAVGITTDDLARQLELVRGEREIAVLRDADGAQVPVVLRVGASEDLVDPAQLGAVLIHPGGSDAPAVRLDAVADLRAVPGPTRICRYDGQRGVVFGLEAADPNGWLTLLPAIEAGLPAGYRWSWID